MTPDALRGLDVAIVGAGIGGLAAALALARAGARPRVFEAAVELREVGAGISLSPNAVKGLWYLGLRDELHARADMPAIQRTRHYRTGEALVTISRHDTPERYGAPYYQMHRADLHAMLREALEALVPDAIRLDHRLSRLEERTDGVRLEFERRAPVGAGLAIGADGLRSVMREQHLHESHPTFTGYVAWRGLVDGARVGHLGLGEGSSVFAAPGRLFVYYPVRHGAVLNWVAFARTGEWTPESWSEPATTAEVETVFADFHDEVLGIVEASSDQRCNKWGLFARPPVSRWTTDRVALLGDAAHPMLPWFGQGAATAIEDGVVLCRALAAADSAAEGLTRYERARHERLDEIYEESLLGGERLAGEDTGSLANKPPKTEDTLGISSYDPAAAPL